jgi:hypothetical protein
MAQRSLLKGGWVVTMAPGAAPFRGDVLIEDDRIAAVGRLDAVGDAEIVDARRHIVLPGFVDSHRHMWQSGCARSRATGPSRNTSPACAVTLRAASGRGDLRRNGARRHGGTGTPGSASPPERITVRNLPWRRMVIHLIESDASYGGGGYDVQPATPPRHGAACPMVGSSRVMASELGSVEAADARIAQTETAILENEDANDVIW